MPRRRVSAADMERRRQAVELRLAGLTYPAIAERLGWRSHASAHAAVQAGLADAVREPSAQLVQLELARLDAMQHAIWPRAMRGNLAAIDRALAISARRSKLLGLDRPTAFDVTHVDADLDVEIDRMLAELLDKQADTDR